MIRRVVLAGLAAWLCAFFSHPESAVALDLNAGVDLDYSYSQADVGGEVNATTLFNQKYEIKYATSLTTAHDFLGAVRLDLQNSWYTGQANTSRIGPTLEMSTKGSQLAARAAYEMIISSTDAYFEKRDTTSYSSSLTFELELTPEIWPEVKLKFQRRRDFQDYLTENLANTFEFSTRKDFYGVRLDFSYKHDDVDNALPAHTGSTGNTWSAKATYKEILWGGTEFELAYELNEASSTDRTRGVFSGDSASYNQALKTRLKNSLVIGPRMTLGLSWEYQFDQDLLTLDYDFKLKNKYAVDLRWDTYDWLRITSEARRETDLTAAVDGQDDERARTDGLKAGVDLTSISWLQVSGKAEFKNEGKIKSKSGGSVDKITEERFEFVAKNRLGEFWDLTLNATTANRHTDDVLTNRETRAKADLRLKLFGLAVTPGYEVSRTNDWDRTVDFPTNQRQTRDATIKFEYQAQLLDMFKATFSHDYSFKVEDTLDEVLNFERLLQFSEDTRLTVVLAEIFGSVHIEGEIDRKATDIADDPDPELVELSYALKMDWKIEHLSVLSSIKYNDKGDAFDDLSFNAKANWKGERIEVTGEYQFDKIIKDRMEPKDEKRKLNLKFSYRF